jgi:hypothetical protein
LWRKELQSPNGEGANGGGSREAGEIAKRDDRPSIAASGFCRKWQNALRVNFYPPQGDSRAASTMPIVARNTPPSSIARCSLPMA